MSPFIIMVAVIVITYVVIPFSRMSIESREFKKHGSKPTQEIMRLWRLVPEDSRRINMREILRELDQGFPLYWEVNEHFQVAGEFTWNNACAHGPTCEFHNYVTLYDETRRLYEAHEQRRKVMQLNKVDIKSAQEILRQETEVIESVTKDFA